jgi:hypothetical protein
MKERGDTPKWPPVSPPKIFNFPFIYNAMVVSLVFLYADPYTDFASGDRWTSSDPSR